MNRRARRKAAAEQKSRERQSKKLNARVAKVATGLAKQWVTQEIEKWKGEQQG